MSKSSTEKLFYSPQDTLFLKEDDRVGTCSNVIQELQDINFDILSLDESVIDKLHKETNLCPEDKFYLEKISKLVQSSRNEIEDMVYKYSRLKKENNQAILNNTLKFKNEFNEIRKIHKNVVNEKKLLEEKNIKLEKEKKQLTREINECKSKIPVTSKRNTNRKPAWV
jgi:hypothetical protein